MYKVYLIHFCVYQNGIKVNQNEMSNFDRLKVYAISARDIIIILRTLVANDLNLASNAIEKCRHVLYNYYYYN